MNSSPIAVTFDPVKNATNIEKHGVSLSLASVVLNHPVATVPDTRFDYGEMRYITAGYVEKRLYIAVWTMKDDYIRAISVRKANKREVTRYEK